MMALWNPWHGCRKISAGCMNCYVYRIDAKYHKDSHEIKKTSDFNLPLRRDRQKNYKIPSGEMVYTCFTSDFLLEDADKWREQAWQIIKARKDLQFLFITKRIHRFASVKPKDWGTGYENVHIGCTVENQERADYRLPIFLNMPIKYKYIICEPLLGQINLLPYLDETIKEVLVGGESGNEARICDYNWILDVRYQCIQKEVPFHFKQTGAKLLKDGKLYHIKRKYQHIQAKKANIDFKYSNQ